MEDEDDSFDVDGNPINFSSGDVGDEDDELPGFAVNAGFEAPGALLTPDADINNSGSGGGVTINNSTGGTSGSQSTLASAFSNIGNAIGSIVKNLTGGQTATVTSSAGQPVGQTSALGTQLGNVAGTITGAVTSFLPLILIGVVLWFVVRVFSKHSR